MHDSVLEFLEQELTEEEVAGKAVLEVGSYDVNGSARSIVQALLPSKYLGVDYRLGPGVDEEMSAEDLKLDSESFDIVISTETLEHIEDWRRAISELKRVLKPEGLLLLTTRSPGFPFHGYPNDFWRFTLSDFSVIFSDLEFMVLQSDPEVSGVFLKARKPPWFEERELGGVDIEKAPPPPPPPEKPKTARWIE